MISIVLDLKGNKDLLLLQLSGNESSGLGLSLDYKNINQLTRRLSSINNALFGNNPLNKNIKKWRKTPNEGHAQ